MLLPGPETLASRFSRQFEILLADNDSLRQRVYQVRHGVYCKELGALQSINGLEVDEYDEHSLHVLLRDYVNDIDIGCIRVVEPLKHGGGLPFESFALRHVDRRLLDWKQLDPTQCCEFSRLAILENIRRQSNGMTGIARIGGTVVAKDLRRLIPSALPYAGIALSLARNYEWMFIVMEPRLHRLLNRFGFNFRQISPLFEWYGQRAVFVFSRDQLLSDMQKWKPEWLELYRYIYESLLGPEKSIACA